MGQTYKLLTFSCPPPVNTQQPLLLLLWDIAHGRLHSNSGIKASSFPLIFHLFLPATSSLFISFFGHPASPYPFFPKKKPLTGYWFATFPLFQQPYSVARAAGMAAVFKKSICLYSPQSIPCLLTYVNRLQWSKCKSLRVSAPSQ